MGGAVAAIDYMKESLIASNAARVADIERGDQVLVGVNAYTETEPTPLDSGVEGIPDGWYHAEGSGCVK